MILFISLLPACGGGSSTDNVKVWGATAELIEDSVEFASPPQVAVDSSGNAVAVWSQVDGGVNSIYSNRYTAAGGWDAAAAELISDSVGFASSPQVAFDGSGNAVAVWSQRDGGVNSIYSNRYTAAGGWDATAAELIEDGVGDAFFPQVAVDGSGNAVAVWTQQDGGVSSIYSNRYTAAGGWDATAAELIEDGVGRANSPQVAVDGSGNAVAVWSQDDGGINSIYSNRYE